MNARTAACRTLLAAAFALSIAAGSALSLGGCSAGTDPEPENAGSATQASAEGAPATASGDASYEKAEVIYATLDSMGAVESVYTVNRFDVKTPGTIIDRGQYGSVAALSETGQVTANGESVNIDADEGVFYYQGDAGAIDLPWKVSFGYKLNGRDVSPDELGGASGSLEISIDTKRNDAVSESAFYDSFMLQITLSMPTSSASDIKAEGATIATAGKNTTAAFAVLPGHDAHLTLSANVEDFTMDGIQIAALPYSQAMEMPDTSELTSGMETLSAGVAGLAGGAAQLASGATQLAAGSSEFGSGLETLAASGDQLIEASSQMSEALQAVSDALGKIDLDQDISSQISQLPAILRQAADALEAQASTAHDVWVAFEQARSALGAAMETLRSDLVLDDAQIEAALAQVEDTDAYATVQTLARSYADARAVIAAYDGTSSAFAEAAALLESIGGDDALATAQAQAALMREAADLLEAGGDESLAAKLQELISGLSQMAGQFAAFHNGVVQFADGVDRLSESYSGLEEGTGELAAGATALSQGLGALSASVALIPQAISTQIDAMLNDFTFPAFEPVSFMSPDNQHVTQVQFVMATPAIKAPDPPDEPDAEQPEPTIFDRVIALFE